MMKMIPMDCQQIYCTTTDETECLARINDDKITRLDKPFEDDHRQDCYLVVDGSCAEHTGILLFQSVCSIMYALSPDHHQRRMRHICFSESECHHHLAWECGCCRCCCWWCSHRLIWWWGGDLVILMYCGWMECFITLLLFIPLKLLNH